MNTTVGISGALVAILIVAAEYVRRKWTERDSRGAELRDLRAALREALECGNITDAAYLARRLDRLRGKQ